MLKSAESSLSEVMKDMWEKFGKTGVGYKLGDFERSVLLCSKEQEKMISFFQSFVFGKEDLLPILKGLMMQIGIEIQENFEGNALLHLWGIRKDESGIITQIHPASEAYHLLMKNDKILDYANESEQTNNQVKFHIERFGKIISITLRESSKKYFPKFTLITLQHHKQILKGIIGIENPLP
jgi:predicted metalloprotease with PDZ domain